MQPTLHQQLGLQSNNYQELERLYIDAGGAPVNDPFASILQPVGPLTLSASVIIPAWNAAATIEACLQAIALSSFNQKYPGQLEVIVVDDGSTDGTWELLQQLNIPALCLRAVRQSHASRAQTQNTAIAIAAGDVIISCDADMILGLFSIEELVKRHQIMPNVLLIGFRQDVASADPRVQPATLADDMAKTPPQFANDLRLNYYNSRFNYYPAGWPDNLCRDGDHLKRLGANKHLFMADKSAWPLAHLVFGALFSWRKSDFVNSGGYDERFTGWGVEDTLVGAHASALGALIIPVYSATGCTSPTPTATPISGRISPATPSVCNFCCACPMPRLATPGQQPPNSASSPALSEIQLALRRLGPPIFTPTTSKQ